EDEPQYERDHDQGYDVVIKDLRRIDEDEHVFKAGCSGRRDMAFLTREEFLGELQQHHADDDGSDQHHPYDYFQRHQRRSGGWNMERSTGMPRAARSWQKSGMLPVATKRPRILPFSS